MRLAVPIRRFAAGLLFAGLLASDGLAGAAARSSAGPQAEAAQQPQAPIERRPPSTSSSGDRVPTLSAHPGLRGEHLAEWMNQHNSLSPLEQQRALEHEPGFGTLPAQTQQRMRDRLAQLDAMPPQRRERLLARTEAMERLSPDQRAQVRGAMAQLGSLPLEDRRPVAHLFQELRQIPPGQRLQAYQSGRYGAPLDAAQQAVLMNLLQVEPLMGSMLVPTRPQVSPAPPPPTNSFH